jgi:hypothetical protein
VSRPPGQWSVTEQLDAFRAALARNEVLVEVLARATRLDLPDWYLTAGCLVQTVWNVMTGRPPTNGIRDHDLFYFDPDLSWEAENTVIEAGAEIFAGVPAVVEIRNEARVHLWYEDHFGVPCPPICVDRSGHRLVRRHDLLPGRSRERRRLARVRAPRARRRVQPRHPAQPGAGTTRCLRDKGAAVERGVAGVDRAAVAGLWLRPLPAGSVVVVRWT